MLFARASGTFVLLLPFLGCTADERFEFEEVAGVFSPKPQQVLPHDRAAFTQGLLWHQGLLAESTGLYGSSTVRLVEPDTGRVVFSMPIGDAYFGEGLSAIGAGEAELFYQLTWKEGVALAYRRQGQRFVKANADFRYEGEGWGLTTLGDELVMSNGTEDLQFMRIAPGSTGQAVNPVRVVTVTDGGYPVFGLNELEVVDQWILANLLGKSRVAVIDPATGVVQAYLTFSEAALLNGYRLTFNQVLNGIAYRPQTGALYITGKQWPSIFVFDWSALRTQISPRGLGDPPLLPPPSLPSSPTPPNGTAPPPLSPTPPDGTAPPPPGLALPPGAP